jgi:hypothetical protein
MCHIKISIIRLYKGQFNVSLGGSGFENYTGENLNWKKFKTEVTDSGLLIMNGT